MGARIDRESEGTRLQAGEYRGLRDGILATARSIPLAVVDAIEGIRGQKVLAPLLDRRLLQRTVKGWSRRGLPSKLREAWAEQHLPEQLLKDVDEAVRSEGFDVRSLDVALERLPEAAALIAKGIEEDAVAVLDLAVDSRS